MYKISTKNIVYKRLYFIHVLLIWYQQLYNNTGSWEMTIKNSFISAYSFMFSGWESIAKSSWSCSMAKMKEKYFKILLPVHFLHPITSLFATGSRKISINTTGYIQIIGTEYFNLKCWPVLLSYWCLIFLALKHFSIFRKKNLFCNL